MATAPTKHRVTFPDNSDANYDNLESTFFNTPGRQLPDPSTLGAPKLQRTVIVSDLRLAVKYGPDVTVDEAITMCTVRKAVGHHVPVPEVFGWRTRNDIVYIYMELISGATLDQRLKSASFSTDDQSIICEQLKVILTKLRQLTPEPDNETFIGTITRGPLKDRCFEDRPPAGPFENLGAFYAWMEWLVQRFLNPSQRYKDPYLELMPQNSPIVFTHADMHPTNIMVSTTSPPRVLAIIDWEQSGWYPDWWEYFKMCYTTDWDGDWRQHWLPRILDKRDHEQALMAEFTFGFGAT